MPFSLISQLKDVPLAFLDVETTGASASFGDRVIEIGISRWESGREIARYEQLIDPKRRIGAGVVVLTGITQEMCAGQPTFEQQMPRTLELMKGAVVVGHNIRFDLSFLRKEFRTAGVDMKLELEDAPVLDTVRIARRRFGRGGNGLQKLSRRLGYEPPIAHRALPDAITSAVVFEKMIEPVGHWGLCLCDAMREQGGSMTLEPISPRESLLPLELEEALETRGSVMMEYMDASQKRTQRIVKPLEVRKFNGELILVAHCQLRDDRRNFKLDRIVRLTRCDGVAQTAVQSEPSMQDTPAPEPR
jgi:DNA polymerase III epsilon subunit family exonuclease